MLCEPSPPFDSDEYLFEIKWDGDRAIIHYANNDILIQNRRGEDVTFRYPELKNILPGFACRDAIVDGEICGLDENGKSRFTLVQQRSHLEKKFDIELRAKKIPMTFIAFDLLSYDDLDIRKLPLTGRRERLYDIFKPIPPFSLWSLSCEKEGRGTLLFRQAEALGLEGIVGKKLDSPYLEGRRSPYWKKCKCQKTKDLWFSQYTVNNAGIRVEDENGNPCQVAGHWAREVKEKIDTQGKCLIEVKYLEETENGRLRQPTFKAMK
jgi:ATP-dependent DNA ligase